MRRPRYPSRRYLTSATFARWTFSTWSTNTHLSALASVSVCKSMPSNVSGSGPVCGCMHKSVDQCECMCVRMWPYGTVWACLYQLFVIDLTREINKYNRFHMDSLDLYIQRKEEVFLICFLSVKVHVFTSLLKRKQLLSLYVLFCFFSAQKATNLKVMCAY